jgi:hypothetical protein
MKNNAKQLIAKKAFHMDKNEHSGNAHAKM